MLDLFYVKELSITLNANTVQNKIIDANDNTTCTFAADFHFWYENGNFTFIHYIYINYFYFQ